MNDAISASLRWDDLAAFLAVARSGGLSAAARETGGSAPTLGRRMRALERALGRELFLRRTHGYDLTEAGAALRRDLEGVAARIDRIAARPPGEAPPLVKLSAGTWTTLLLVRRVAELVGDPPDLRMRFLADERRLDLGRREAAIGLRNARPTEAGLAGRRIARVHFAVYARPDAPARWIRVAADTPSARWTASRAGDEASHEVSQPRLALDMALAGVGRAVLPTFIGDAEPALGRVGEPIAELGHDQWLVTHDEDRSLPEVRRAIDRVVALLRG
jgi:DNA-binding transcriptional LysR family regulator